MSAKTIRQHVRRGLPLVDLPVRQAGKRIDLIVYGAWLNQQAPDRPRGAEPGIRPAAGPGFGVSGGGYRMAAWVSWSERTPPEPLRQAAMPSAAAAAAARVVM